LAGKDRWFVNAGEAVPSGRVSLIDINSTRSASATGVG